MILPLILRTILRYPVGNASAANMDESALGPWVSVVRKSSRRRKVPIKTSEGVFFFYVRFPRSLL